MLPPRQNQFWRKSSKIVLGQDFVSCEPLLSCAPRDSATCERSYSSELRSIFLKRILRKCWIHTTIFIVLRRFEGRSKRALSQAFIRLCIDSALGNIEISNIVAGGRVRLCPLSCDKWGLETLKLCIPSRPEFMLLQAQINGHVHIDSLPRDLWCKENRGGCGSVHLSGIFLGRPLWLTSKSYIFFCSWAAGFPRCSASSFVLAASIALAHS